MTQEEILGKPFWVNGDFNWYLDTVNQDFLISKNGFNLPPLKNLQCCIVINEKENVKDFVLIDNKQNIICSYDYPKKQHEYETKIKMLKIKKYYDECEGIKTDI
jgi:hypothetical protein